MTLWDFYRTLPYPLPIKDELDEMKSEIQQPWLSLLVNRFVDTEACAKQELNLSLATIFNHSEPRKKTSTNSKQHSDHRPQSAQNSLDPNHCVSNEHDGNSDSKDHDSAPHFEAEAYDKDSKIIQDNHNHEAIIPDGNPADAVSKNTDMKAPSNKAALSAKNNIITEADNPAASP